MLSAPDTKAVDLKAKIFRGLAAGEQHRCRVRYGPSHLGVGMDYSAGERP